MKVCGQHSDPTLLNNKRKVLGFEGSTVCLETVMNQSYTVLEDEEMDELFLHAPEIINTVRNDGCVTDNLLDTLGIVKLPGDLHINRDNMVTWRQHAHVLSHIDSKAKFTNYLRMRAERDDPALQLQKKDQEQALKIVQRAAKLKEKEDAAVRDKAVRAAERDVEKARRFALSSEDKKTEDALKRAAAALKKAAKQAEIAEQLRIAEAVLTEVADP